MRKWVLRGLALLLIVPVAVWTSMDATFWPLLDRFGEPRYAFLKDRPLFMIGEAPFPAYANYVYTWPGTLSREVAAIQHELVATGFRRENFGYKQMVDTSASGAIFSAKDTDGEEVEVVISPGRAIGSTFHIDADDVTRDRDARWVTVEISKARPGARLWLWRMNRQ